MFSTPNTELVTMDYNSFNFDQKVTRVMGAHAVKFGFRWSREMGFKTNPQANGFTYNNLDDLLANRASDFLLAMGNPPHSAWLDQFGGFIQDDWRVNRQVRAQRWYAVRHLPGVWLQSPRRTRERRSTT